jgi:small conductance mechanosensitive channel
VQEAARVAIDVALKVAAAAGAWFIGRKLITLALQQLERMLERQKVDATVSRYACRSVTVALNVVLLITLLGFFGVQTTSFAALFAAGGVAIGVAWSGLLANFAAGTFLVVLRPFKVGDAICAGGVTGTVESIGLFGTVIVTGDNVTTIVGNNKVFADVIQNFSASEYRRVDVTVLLGSTVDFDRVIRLLRQRVSRIPHVLSEPAPEVDMLELTAAGPLLCVRPCCRNEHYGQVRFDINRAIRETFDEAGIQTPSVELLLQALQGAMVRKAP